MEETLKVMLYTDKGIAWTMTIRDEFCEHQRRVRRGEKGE